MYVCVCLVELGEGEEKKLVSGKGLSAVEGRLYIEREPMMVGCRTIESMPVCVWVWVWVCVGVI